MMRNLALLALFAAASLAAAASDSFVVIFDHATPTMEFHRDGHQYVVTDTRAVERARAIVKPQVVLGEQQAALGAKQAALGAKQAALGMRLAALRSDDDDARAAINRQLTALEQQQDALHDQQEALSRQQDKLRDRVEQQLHDLAEECMRKGTARKQ